MSLMSRAPVTAEGGVQQRRNRLSPGALSGVFPKVSAIIQKVCTLQRLDGSEIGGTSTHLCEIDGQCWRVARGCCGCGQSQAIQQRLLA